MHSTSLSHEMMNKHTLRKLNVFNMIAGFENRKIINFLKCKKDTIHSILGSNSLSPTDPPGFVHSSD